MEKCLIILTVKPLLIQSRGETLYTICSFDKILSHFKPKCAKKSNFLLTTFDFLKPTLHIKKKNIPQTGDTESLD